MTGYLTPASTDGLWFLQENVAAGVHVAPAWAQLGVNPRAVTGTTSTDTILYSDNEQPVDYTGTVAVAVTLPTATTLGNAAFSTLIENDQATNSVTITPTTWTIGAPGATGTSSLVVAAKQRCRISIDPTSSTNWWGQCSPTSSGGGGITIQGNCPGTISGAGTWGVLNMGGNPASGQCANAWNYNVVMVMTHACTLKNLYYSQPSIAGASSSDQVVTAWTSAGVHGSLAASALTCTAGTGYACSDTTHTVSLTAGSIVSVQIVTVASSVVGNFNVGMECD